MSIIDMDRFEGTDDQKLDLALLLSAVPPTLELIPRRLLGRWERFQCWLYREPGKPVWRHPSCVVMLPPRNVVFKTGNRVAFSGMKIMGQLEEQP